MPKRNSVIPPRKYHAENLCRGTFLWRSGAISSSHPNRSSSHLRMMLNMVVLGLAFTADHNFFATAVHLVGRQRAWRRAGNVAPIQVVHSVMAGAPNLSQVAAVLDGAAEMGASRGHRPVLALPSVDQNAGAASKAKNLEGVGLEL